MPDAAVRDAIRAQYQDEVRTLSDQLNSGDIDIDQWQGGMKQALRDSYALNLRAGSDSPLKYTEYLKLGTPLQKQYRFLERFKQDIAAGKTKAGAIATRAQMYIFSAVQMYWRQVVGIGLPAYPGDGTTDCVTACQCEWEERDDGFYWRLGDAHHCHICPERAQEWAPYNPNIPLNPNLFADWDAP